MELGLDLRYARSADGTKIAYVSVDRESHLAAPPRLAAEPRLAFEPRPAAEPPLIWLPPVPFSNVVAQWQIPPMRQGYELIASRVPLVMYDGRGTGHSQRDVADLGLDAHLSDLAAVVDHAGLDRFALLGFYVSCMPALAYAARHPDRVTKVILFGGSARGLDPMSPPETQALLTLLERNWDLFVDTAALAWMGWSAGESGRLAANAFRSATSPAIARATLEAAAEMDVSDELRNITAPTVMLYRMGDRQMPVSVLQALVASLPNGRLQLIEGSSAALLVERPREDARTILDFLTDAARPAAVPVADASIPDQLTPRQAQVLRLIAQGETNDEVAHRLGISINTVERHAANLYRKIGARGRADATAYAVRHGLA